MNKVCVATALAGTAIASIACSSTSTQDTTDGLQRSTTPPHRNDHRNNYDHIHVRDRGRAQRLEPAKLATFVAAFRTCYPELAREREDASIAVRPCEDIAHSADEQRISTESDHWPPTTAPNRAKQMYSASTRW